MFNIAGKSIKNRLFLGTGRYPSPKILQDCIIQSDVDVITVSLRRENFQSREGGRFWELLKETKKIILPNTAGCYNVKDAINTAHMARELFNTTWIKLEVIADNNLQPCPFGTVEAARILQEEGFDVFPYTTEDAVVADHLVNVGCKILMPWGSPIGTGMGLNNPKALEHLRLRFPDVFLVVDAGIGKTSHAVQAMEMGYDAVLVNTAIANAYAPILMAQAFNEAVRSGRKCYDAIPMKVRDNASPSSPTLGMCFS